MCGTEEEEKLQTNEKEKGEGQEKDGIVSGSVHVFLQGLSSLLYQHCGCVLQEGGSTHPGAQPKGQRILGGYACWGWVQGGHHQGCAGTLEEGGRIGEGSVRAGWKEMSFNVYLI